MPTTQSNETLEWREFVQWSWNASPKHLEMLTACMAGLDLSLEEIWSAYFTYWYDEVRP